MDSPSHHAAGADSLIAVTERARAGGFGSAMMVEADGILRCAECDTRFGAAGYEVAHVNRLEGASDVADMLVAVSGRCPHCSAGSMLVLGYGPNGSIEDDAVLVELDLDDAGPLLP